MLKIFYNFFNPLAANDEITRQKKFDLFCQRREYSFSKRVMYLPVVYQKNVTHLPAVFCEYFLSPKEYRKEKKVILKSFCNVFRFFFNSYKH